MMISRAWRLGLLGHLLLLGQPALGLGLVADGRFVTNNLGDGEAPAFFAPARIDVFGALLDSSIAVTPDGLGLEESLFMAAAGFLEELFDPETGEPLGIVHIQGTSHYSITFDGDLVLDGFAQPLGGAGPVPSFLRVLAGMAVLYERPWDEGATFDFAAELAPGLYTVEAQLGPASFDNDMGLELTWQVRDSAVPIPEPAAALLFAPGFAALAARRQRALRRVRTARHAWKATQ